MNDRDDRVRETAIRALHGLSALDQPSLDAAALDESPRVRRALADVGATDHRVNVATLIGDADSSVCEVACWAAGERGEATAALIELLASVTTGHADPLCRESAVAALGAIGSELGLGAILSATSDKATVRRRAVLALAPFDSPEVTAGPRTSPPRPRLASTPSRRGSVLSEGSRLRRFWSFASSFLPQAIRRCAPRPLRAQPGGRQRPGWLVPEGVACSRPVQWRSQGRGLRASPRRGLGRACGRGAPLRRGSP